MIKSNPLLFYLIVGCTAAFIIGLNVSLFSWVKNSNLKRQMKMTRSMVNKIQSPWADEDADLAELSTRVEHLSEGKNDSPEEKQHPGQL
jgi:hypothetical protein